MVLLEAEVHSSLLGFLRERERFHWQHHLTMGRLVARALRLQRSSLLQTGTTLHRYCLSYLTPALMGNDPAILVAPDSELTRLLDVEIPKLEGWLQTEKAIVRGDRWPGEDFQGLLLIEPKDWLADRLLSLGRIPDRIPTLIDRAEELETWTVHFLTGSIAPRDWIEAIESYPRHAELIRSIQAKLARSILSHPPNPYGCYLIDATEREHLQSLLEVLTPELPIESAFVRFWRKMGENNYLPWTSVNRETGQFTLQISPMEVAGALKPIWPRQPFVLMGGFLDPEKSADLYRQQHGVGETLTVKFSADRESEFIHLYLPERLPAPNTPEFQRMLIERSRELIDFFGDRSGSIVLIIEDVPLRSRIATLLAADYGSRVQVEKNAIGANGILVCGWQFWREHQEDFPIPHLLIVATLPLPSPENPLVAGRIAYHKRQHRDWFRLYLLPTAVREIQRSVMPSRSVRGIVAVLDTRVNARSYGKQILAALEPYARVNYLDEQLFSEED
ncbi:helicase C-terminal domain-containing protein [Pannus brasiliensis CCIBt3594]|uniref:Helicase C-terminal domain-containing protein n=1 Tax=Pannus brasiliensis CCIBt3594 TaxID=1427578 RepID=A0AAW9QZR6_9CHRO